MVNVGVVRYVVENDGSQSVLRVLPNAAIKAAAGTDDFWVKGPAARMDVMTLALGLTLREKALTGVLRMVTPPPPPAPPASKYRKENSQEELWAITGLSAVAAMDRDRATIVNGVGFSKSDGDFGHSLVDKYRQYGKLSDKQWAAALKLAKRYRRQIGGEA